MRGRLLSRRSSVGSPEDAVVRVAPQLSPPPSLPAARDALAERQGTETRGYPPISASSSPHLPTYTKAVHRKRLLLFLF